MCMYTVLLISPHEHLGASAEATERRRDAKGKAGKAAVKYMVTKDTNWTL